MAFSFECPHCAQSFEAELELCGSTCNCPNCGLLFLVPEIDLAALEAGAGSAPVEGGAALLAVLESARGEIRRLEEDLRTSSERWARRQSELEKERGAAQALALRAEASVKGPTEELSKVRVELERVTAEKAALAAEKTALALEKDALALETAALALETAALAKAGAEELAREKARLAELEAEREAAKARALAAEASAKGPAAELAKVRGELERVTAEKTALALEKNALALETAALAKAGAEELAREKARLAELEAEREAAKARALAAEASAKGPAAEFAKVRGELERVTAEKTALALEKNALALETVALAKAGAEALAREKARLAELEAEREAAKTRALAAEASAKGALEELAKVLGELERVTAEKTALAAEKASAKPEPPAKKSTAELAKARAQIELLSKEKAALETTHAEELSRERARCSDLEAGFEAEKVRALAAEHSAKQPAEELLKLSVELERVKAEKAAGEKAHAGEIAHEKNRLAEVDREREMAVRRADQTDAATKALSSEMERLIAANAAAERKAAEGVQSVEGRLHRAERERDEISHRSEEQGREILSLQAKVTDLSKKVVSGIGTPAGEADLGLEKLLQTRELEIKKITEQLRHALTANKALSQGGLVKETTGIPLVLQKKEVLASLALAVGLVVGVGVSRLVSPTESAHAISSEVSSPVKEAPAASTVVAGAAKEPEASAHKSAGGETTAGTATAPPGGNDRAPMPPPSSSASSPAQPASAQVTQAGTAGFASGMPSRLPDSFLGLKFGTPVSEIAGRGQWQETEGKYHRKAELLGAQVEAVLSSDDEGRLIMGSYVRIVPRQENAVAPFLEWAVNSQDAVSALYGEPSRLRPVEGATDATEVVRRITAGEDYYEASWERDGEDTMMDLSIRPFSVRSIVFRLEYRSRDLVSAYAQRREANKETPPEKSVEEAPK